jgi:hypothetical protein
MASNTNSAGSVKEVVNCKVTPFPIDREYRETRGDQSRFLRAIPETDHTRRIPAVARF